MNGETLYVDASAAVKLYVEEPGSDEAFAAIGDAGALVASRVLYTEVGAAIPRRLTANHAAVALTAWERLWTDFDVVEVDAHIATHALSLAQYHGLGTLDAIHLASALRVPAAPMRFATWDKTLAEAAHAVGLRTIPDLGRDPRRVPTPEEAAIVAVADAEADLPALARQSP